MPVFRLETNQTRCHVPRDFHKTTADLIAKILEKPTDRICVVVVTDVNMSRGGCTEPCGYASLLSIGKLSEEENKRHSFNISVHLEKFLGIPRKRLVIHFIDERPENLGNSGTTYAELLQEYKPKKKKKGSSSESDSSDEDSKKKKKSSKRRSSDEGKKSKKASVDEGGNEGPKSEGDAGPEGEAGDQDTPAEGADAGDAAPEGEAPPEGEPEEGEGAEEPAEEEAG